MKIKVADRVLSLWGSAFLLAHKRKDLLFFGASCGIILVIFSNFNNGGE